MKQSRAMSLVEANAKVIVGDCMAVVTQIQIFPIAGLQVPLAHNLALGAAFTVHA